MFLRGQDYRDGTTNLIFKSLDGILCAFRQRSVVRLTCVCKLNSTIPGVDNRVPVEAKITLLIPQNAQFGSVLAACLVDMLIRRFASGAAPRVDDERLHHHMR